MKHAFGRRHGRVGATVVLASAFACSGGLPGMEPMKAAPPMASGPWKPPRRLATSRPSSTGTGADSEGRAEQASGAAGAGPPLGGAPPQVVVHAEDLSLPELAAIALQNNPSTQSSWAAARAAAAAHGESQSSYYPSIEIGVAVTRQQGLMQGGRVFYENTHLGPGAKLAFLVLDFGARSARADAARETLLASNWEHNQVVQDVVFRVATVYHQLIGAISGLREAEVSLQEAETSLSSAEELMNAGVGTVTDVLLAQAQYAQSELDVVDRRGRVAVARGELATAMGLPADVYLNISAEPGDPQIDRARADVDELIAQALAQRPALAAAVKRMRAAEFSAREADADLAPTLNLDAAVGWTQIYGPGFTNSGVPYSASLIYSYPLFEGFALQNAARKKHALVEEARAQWRDEQERVILQVWTSYQNLVTAGQSFEASIALLRSAETSYASALTAYRSGLNTIVALMQAQVTLATARFLTIDARTDWYVALAALARGTGNMPLSGEAAPPGDTDPPGTAEPAP